MQDTLNEWLIMDDEIMNFHIKQYENPYRSTVKFWDFLSSQIKNTRGNKILDLGCGAGAALGYILNEGVNFISEGVGIDINSEVVDIGNRILKQKNIRNGVLKAGDIFNLDDDGFVCGGGLQV